MIRVRCLTRKCNWVGYMDAFGHLNGRIPEDEWGLTPCPRCRGLYGVYA